MPDSATSTASPSRSSTKSAGPLSKSAGQIVVDLSPVLQNDLIAFFLSCFPPPDHAKVLENVLIIGIKRLQADGLAFQKLAPGDLDQTWKKTSNTSAVGAVASARKSSPSTKKNSASVSFSDAPSVVTFPSHSSPQFNSSNSISTALTSTSSSNFLAAGKPRVAGKSSVRTPRSAPQQQRKHSIYPDWWGHREHIGSPKVHMQEHLNLTSPLEDWSCAFPVFAVDAWSMILYTDKNGLISKAPRK